MEIGNFRWRRFLYMTIQYSVIPYNLNLHSQQTEKVWKSHLLPDKSLVLPQLRLFPPKKTCCYYFYLVHWRFSSTDNRSDILI